MDGWPAGSRFLSDAPEWLAACMSRHMLPIRLLDEGKMQFKFRSTERAKLRLEIMAALGLLCAASVGLACNSTTNGEASQDASLLGGTIQSNTGGSSASGVAGIGGSTGGASSAPWTGGSTEGGTGGGGASGTGGSATGGTATPVGTGGAGGHGGSSPEPLWPDLVGKLDLPTCNDGGTRSSPLQVNPTSPVDYLAVCETTWTSSGVPGAIIPYRILEESGTACGGATDAVACRASLEAVTKGLALSQSCGGPPYDCQHFVVTTAGDTVRRWMPNEYTTLLGPIDTADEARLLTNEMTFQGLSVASCGSIRATADGFDVVGTRLTSDCAPIVLMREQEHVASDGTVTVVRSNVASVSDACI